MQKYNIFYKYANFYKNGVLHREDGPALITDYGKREWYFNGELHRENAPAVIHHDGSKEYFLNGVPHREDGPACEWSNGIKEYYINGRLVTKSAFEEKMFYEGKIVSNGENKFKLVKV